MKFEDIIENENIYLYLGDIPDTRPKLNIKKFIGLSLTTNNGNHIQHDVRDNIPLNDNTVDIIQSEDVMEHIEYDLLKDIINEMYRILKKDGLFRLSVPDYKCDILYNRSEKDDKNEIFFDPGGGGEYDNENKKVINGGHVWFPIYKSVADLLKSTNFVKNNINFLQYYDDDNNQVIKDIDYSLGYISRTADNDDRVKNPKRPMSIVIDCYK